MKQRILKDERKSLLEGIPNLKKTMNECMIVVLNHLVNCTQYFSLRSHYRNINLTSVTQYLFYQGHC
jgi:hypothetical protein